jgi:hypothetical protein
MEKMFKSIEFIQQINAANPSLNKAGIQSEWAAKFLPDKARSVFVGDGYALRFSEANTGSFSNTVLSLSALQLHDEQPFVVVVSRPRTVDFYLANTTFLKRISHSSLLLRMDNVKGSFNGTDIFAEYEGTVNRPSNFPLLFAQHSSFSWEENLERLVEATNEIIARVTRFEPSEYELKQILAAPRRSIAALNSKDFNAIENELISIIQSKSDEIIRASLLDNVNLRGNAIEQIITTAGNAHELGDLMRPLPDGKLVIDIKTKLLDRASAPKAYNVDKTLRFLSEHGSVFAFFMIGVDAANAQVSGRLLPVLEKSLLASTVVQHHWAGRGSRGVTQLSGPFGNALDANYVPTVDEGSAQRFLQGLIDL